MTPTEGLAAEAARYLRLPDRNPFFPKDLEVRPLTEEGNRDSLERYIQGWMKTMEVGDGARQRFQAALPVENGIVPRRPRRAVEALGCWAWHLQDEVSCTPRSELWLKFSLASMVGIKDQTLLAWLVRVWSDMLNETVYLAEQASLDLRLRDDFYGFDMRAGGFHEKLPELLAEGCRVLRKTATPEGWSGDETFLRRCGDQREDLLRHWRNEYLKPEDHCADLRRAVVMPEVKYLSSSKAEVLKDLDLRQLQGFAEALIPKLCLEVLYQGNVTRNDFDQLISSLPDLLGQEVGPVSGMHAPHPAFKVAEVPSGQPIVLIQDSPDAKNRNVAVEMYWQLGRPCLALESRETAKVELLSAILTEPLFDQLRTKQQLGYVASCGARWTHHVQGFSVWLMSAKYAPADICRRVDAFLEGFQKTLAEMSEEDFHRHVDALSAAKVEPERTLHGMQQTAWAELQERSHSFDRPWREALALYDLKKSELQDLLQHCSSPERRLVITAALGGRAKCCSSAAAAAEALGQAYPAARFISLPHDLPGMAVFDA